MRIYADYIRICDHLICLIYVETINRATNRLNIRIGKLRFKQGSVQHKNDFSIVVYFLRFEDSEATLDAVFPPNNEDYGFILVDPPCKEIQRGELKNEHASNTGYTFKSDDFFWRV